MHDPRAHDHEELRDLLPNVQVPFGLRTVDGSFNNLFAGQSEFGAADNLFPRLLDPVFRTADGGTSYAQTSGTVIDAQPRIISNLIVDQTANNPAAVAAAFAWPLAAGAAGDKPSASSAGSDKASAGASTSAGASKDAKASGGATKDDGGAEAMFKALDKDKDGSVSKAEAKGTPHDKDFAKLDKNNDGKLSREEHAAAPEHAGKAKSGSAGATGSTGASSSSGAASPAPSSGSKPK